MSSNEVTLADIVTPARPIQPVVGQATQIEQARAIAEVQAAIVVAQQCPRSVPAAVEAMRESCRQQLLADRAFFRYARAGSQVTGASIHLARELARAWGNIQYGITELSRDPEKGESEMLAYAWDVQTNARNSNTFIVSWSRDSRKGKSRLTDERDIYENNANMGARRVRECIFAVLPTWFTEEAKALCMETLRSGGAGKTRQQTIADLVSWFARKGVDKQQIAAKVGRGVDQMTDADLATLRVIATSIDRGEASVEAEFPTPELTPTDLGAKPESARKPKAQPPAEHDPSLPDPADQSDPWQEPADVMA